MKRNDVILIIVILVLTFGFVIASGYRQSRRAVDHAMAVVTVDGEEYGCYPLDEDRTERIELDNGAYNVLTIAGGEASVSEASCRDQICVHHFHIHYAGDTIVCLPNKVVVEIVGGEADDVDAATH